jgi:hypothetical protein
MLTETEVDAPQVGTPYGGLTVTAVSRPKNGKGWRCECRCVCGAAVSKAWSNIKGGKSSCGCLRKAFDRAHAAGLWRSREVEVFKDDKFGRLTVTGPQEMRQRRGEPGRCNFAPCRCSCGTPEVWVESHMLLRGTRKSCGCLVGSPLARRTQQPCGGAGGTPLYTQHRKLLLSHRAGGEVNMRWVRSFLAFKTWAESQGYAEGQSLRRLDPGKGWYPGNCGFVAGRVARVAGAEALQC